METQSGEHRVLTEVYYIPRLKSNIISLGQLDEIGCKYSAEDGVMVVLDQQRKLFARVKHANNRLYILDIQPAQPVCLLSRQDDEAWRWHARYGHVNFHALKKMGREGMVKGLPMLDQVHQVCDGCMLGKQHRNPFPRQARFRAEDKLQLVHG